MLPTQQSAHLPHLGIPDGNGAPTKKPRVDLELETPEDMNAETSTYSIGEHQGDDDPTPFTVVTYRKNRPAGIPVIFKPVVPGSSFWRGNPNRIAQEILTAAQENVQSHRITKDGSVAVTMPSLESANKLLGLSNIAGIDVTTSVPQSYSRNEGKIKDVPLEYTDSELLEYLKDGGVISVRRQIAYAPQSNGNIQASFRSSVILQFRVDCPMPNRVVLGFTSHPVEEYFSPPVRCFRCQRHGHLAANCRGPQRCKICSGEHDFKECTSRRDPKCANCSGPHAASYAGCPRRRAATAVRKHDILHGRAPQRRLPPPNPDAVRPPSTMPSQRPPRVTPQRTTTLATTRSNTQDIMRSQVAARALDPVIPMAPKVPSAVPSVPCTSNDALAASATFPPVTSNQAPKNVGWEQILIPLLFAALKAILRVVPQATDIPEVSTLLSMEPLVTRLSISGSHSS